jgi:hypothetical protein
MYGCRPDRNQLLYDLFFAANMTAFSNIHDTTSVERLVAYIGYFASVTLLSTYTSLPRLTDAECFGFFGSTSCSLTSGLLLTASPVGT